MDAQNRTASALRRTRCERRKGGAGGGAIVTRGWSDGVASGSADQRGSFAKLENETVATRGRCRRERVRPRRLSLLKRSCGVPRVTRYGIYGTNGVESGPRAAIVARPQHPVRLRRWSEERRVGLRGAWLRKEIIRERGNAVGALQLLWGSDQELRAFEDRLFTLTPRPSRYRRSTRECRSEVGSGHGAWCVTKITPTPRGGCLWRAPSALGRRCLARGRRKVSFGK